MQLRLIKEPWISGGGNFETNNNIDFNTIPLPMKKMPPKKYAQRMNKTKLFNFFHVLQSSSLATCLCIYILSM